MANKAKVGLDKSNINWDFKYIKLGSMRLLN